MGEQITVSQALMATVDILGSITVPVSQMESVAMPIHQAIGNIQACLEAMARADMERAEAQKEETEAQDGED